MKTLIILIIALILSMFMAIEKDVTKINNKKTKYIIRVIHCFLGIMMLAAIILWFFVLPILGLIALF
ncbi:hypothetical protein [uncultured Clostridium sp.]|uniref:hypothetical protein n=1 Tax=uncultured Clostridium sp. TaxID=59620 RepID=UPI00260B8263|nr:hypothetical protein [uncultured Clostridium sp.]